MARNGNARTARSAPQKIGQVTNRKTFTVNRHNHDNSGDSSTFLGVVIALVILLIGGAAFMTFQLQRSRAMRAREIEMRLRAREAAEQAKQQELIVRKKNREAEELSLKESQN